MSDPRDPARIRTIVVSDDHDFRRLAAVALGREGHEVRTTPPGAGRLLRMLRSGPADVVVVEGDLSGAETQAIIAAGNMRFGVVRIMPEGDLGLTKWGPLSALAAEVLIAYEHRSNPTPERSLRIVS